MVELAFAFYLEDFEKKMKPDGQVINWNLVAFF